MNYRKRYYIDRIEHWVNKALDKMVEDTAKEEGCPIEEAVPVWDDDRGTLWSDLTIFLNHLEEFRM